MNATSSQTASRPRPYLTLVYTAPLPQPLQPQPGLTTADIADLSAWMRRSRMHGYRAVEIEPGGTSGQPYDDCYAVIYKPGTSWAVWGIAREGDRIVVWESASGKERGRYNSIRDAVGALPILWHGVSRAREGAHAAEARSNVVRLG